MNKKYSRLVELMLLTKDESELDGFIGDLYMAIHLANGDCENPHEGRKIWADKLYEELTK